MADFNEGDFAELIKEVTKIELPDLEKTIFSIGGRGHYENPTSDILAFYLDPEAEHQLGSLVLDSLFLALGKKEIGEKHLHIEREQYVAKGRIDLLLEGDDWVMVIENKIYAAQNNPFEKYEQFVEKKGKNDKFFVILSPEGNSINKKWIGLSYEDFITKIEEKLGSEFILKPFNKWTVFLRDFILNLKQHTEREKMQTEILEFIGKNIEEVLKFEKILKDYGAILIKIKKLLIKKDDQCHHWIYERRALISEIDISSSITDKKEIIKIEIMLFRDGWIFEIYSFKPLLSNTKNFEVIKNKFIGLKDKIKKEQIEFEVKEKSLVFKLLSFNVDTDRIAEVQNKIISRILDVLKEEKTT